MKYKIKQCSEFVHSCFAGLLGKTYLTTEFYTEYSADADQPAADIDLYIYAESMT